MATKKPKKKKFSLDNEMSAEDRKVIAKNLADNLEYAVRRGYLEEYALSFITLIPRLIIATALCISKDVKKITFRALLHAVAAWDDPSYKLKPQHYRSLGLMFWSFFPPNMLDMKHEKEFEAEFKTAIKKRSIPEEAKQSEIFRGLMFLKDFFVKGAKIKTEKARMKVIYQPTVLLTCACQCLAEYPWSLSLPVALSLTTEKSVKELMNIKSVQKMSEAMSQTQAAAIMLSEFATGQGLTVHGIPGVAIISSSGSVPNAKQPQSKTGINVASDETM